MPLDLSFRGRTVLVTDVTVADMALVHALVRDGAHVTVAGADLPTSIRDLVERRIVDAADNPDVATFDVTIKGGAPSGRTDEGACGYGAHSSESGGHSSEGACGYGAHSSESGGHSSEGACGHGAHSSGEGVGTVTLLGGGPGDPGLLTLAGLEAIRTADVIVHDRLAPLESLVHARPDAEIIDVGKIPRGDFTPQERINEVIVEQALAGRNVLRFKGGDSFVFGRGGEEAQACAEAGIPVRIIPGVSSSTAAPALAGIPVTHRSLTQGFTVVSGHVPPGDPRSTLDWAALARTRTTLVVLMGVANLAAISAALIAGGLPADTPAALVADAGLPSMQTVRAPLESIAAAVAESGAGAPAVVVIGDVAALDVLA